MIRNVLPALNNELDSMLKSTAIASSIGMLELTRMGMNIVSREMKPVPIFLTIAVFYVCMSACLNYITRYIEKKLLMLKLEKVSLTKKKSEFKQILKDISLEIPEERITLLLGKSGSGNLKF